MSRNQQLLGTAFVAAPLLALGLGLAMVPAWAADLAAGAPVVAEGSADRSPASGARETDAAPGSLSGRSLYQVKRDLIDFRSSAPTTSPVDPSGRSLEQVKRELILSRATAASGAAVPLSGISLYEAKRRLYLYGDVREAGQR